MRNGDMEESSRIHRVNALVGRFYRSALNVPLQWLKETSLRDLNNLVPFDAALWAIGDVQAGRFHSLRTIGLDDRFSRHLEQTMDINPMFKALVKNPETPLDMADIMPDRQFYASEAYKTICEPFNIQRILGASHCFARSRLYNTIVLFRCDRRSRFTKNERRIHKHLVFHLMNASSLAYSVFLGQVGARDPGRGAAICDRYGVCYETQPAFLSLVAEHSPGWVGDRLPFDLPDIQGNTQVNALGLRFLFEPMGDLFCVSAWREGPMDLLTERERQVVISVCKGLSYKEVARPLGIAPSTVSNHLYRVFDKLGVSSRSELAKLVNPSLRLH